MNNNNNNISKVSSCDVCVSKKHEHKHCFYKHTTQNVICFLCFACEVTRLPTVHLHLLLFSLFHQNQCCCLPGTVGLLAVFFAKVQSSPRFPVSFPLSLHLGSAFPAKGPTPLHSSQEGTGASPDLSQSLPWRNRMIIS